MRASKLLLYTLTALIPVAAIFSEPILIPDPQLSRLIRQKLGKSSKDSIGQSDLNRIFTLDLSSQNIKNITGLKYCKNLTSLNLSNNNIRRIDGLSHLPNILSLNIGGNDVQLISPLQTLSTLSKLVIAYNRIDNISSLSRLKQLKELDAAHNSIKDISPLAGLTNLSNLHLSSNAIKDITGVETLVKLTYMELSRNSIQDLRPLFGLKNLQYLGLGFNFIKDISPLKELRKLEKLVLINNVIADIYPVAGLRKLRWLALNGNRISDVDYLADLRSLTYLNCADNGISTISKLKNCHNLEYLNLTRNRISDISAIGSLKKLEYLGLAENRIKDITALEALENIGRRKIAQGESNIHLSLANNKISDLSPLLRNPHIKEGVIIDVSNNPVTDKKKVIVALHKKGVKVFSFFIKGSTVLAENASLKLQAFEMIGTEVRDITSQCKWRVLEGKKYASFNPDTPGLLVNINLSSKIQKVRIEAIDIRKGKEKRARAVISVHSASRLKKIVINGAGALQENSSLQFYAIAVWEGKKSVNITKAADWKVTEGVGHAHFDTDSPGTLVNDNTTGASQDIVIACTYVHAGKKLTVAKKVRAVDSPFITTISITGPEEIPRGAGGAAFNAVCHWKGKDDEDVSGKVMWKVTGNSQYARFEKGKRGYLIHANKSGKDKPVAISAVLSRGASSWKAEKTVRLTFDPYVSGLIIIGPGMVKEDGSAVYKLRAEWEGREDGYPAEGVVWSFTRGKEHAEFNQRSGTLSNRNTSGSSVEVVLSAQYAGGGVVQKTTKAVILEDTPFLKGIIIKGPDTLPEDGFAKYSAVVQWMGKKDNISPPGISWKVHKGAEYVGIDGKPVLSVNNRNITGKDRTIVLKAIYAHAGESTVTAEKTITLKDTPYISGLKIEGNDTLKEKGSYQYKAVIVWKGKPSESVTSAVKWSIQEGKTWAKFEKGKPGSLINTNNTGKSQKVLIGAFYSKGKVIQYISKMVAVIDSPVIIRVIIGGPAHVEEEGFCDLEVLVKWSDGRAEDKTKEAEWKITEGKKSAMFDKEHTARLINMNSTGIPQEVTVQALVKSRGGAKGGIKKLVCKDSPYVIVIAITGPWSIREEKHSQYSLKAVWSNGKEEEGTSKAQWEIKQGVEYAQFDETVPGKLINANTSGTNRTVTISARFSGGGATQAALKKVEVQDSPYLDTVSIRGPEEIMTDSTGEFGARGVWQGCEDQDITSEVDWSVGKGGEYAGFDPEDKGRLINNNTDPEDKTVTIRAEYRKGHINKTAHKQVVVKGTGKKEEEKEEGKEEVEVEEEEKKEEGKGEVEIEEEEKEGEGKEEEEEEEEKAEEEEM